MADEPNARPVSGEIMAPAGAVPVPAASSTDIVDADYEVLPGGPSAFAAAPKVTGHPASRAAAPPPLEGMAMLRPDDAARPFSARGGPLFWSAGIAVALAAFWVSGGHALVRPLLAVSATRASALEILDVASRVDASGERPVLLVDGEAGNAGAATAALPPLEIRVTGADGGVTRYRLGTAGRSLAPGERFAFSSRFDVPGNGVAAVAVSFADQALTGGR
jgi:hypothetical protein